MGIKFHHIGVRVGKLPDGVPTKRDGNQMIEVAFLELGGARFELIVPTSDDSVVRSEFGVYHTCFEIETLKGADLYLGTIMMVHEPRPSWIFGGRLTAWVYSPYYGLVELLEE